jgi:hypothetical protein
MPRTPDRFPGEREEESLLFETTDPTAPVVNGELRYVQNTGFQYYEGGKLKTFVSLEDLLLVNEPPFPNVSETLTYSGTTLTQEDWTRTVGSTLIRRVTYSYTSTKLTTEIRTVYATDGFTIVAQQTVTYTYSGSRLTSVAYVRNA